MSEISDQGDPLAIALFSELFMADQLARGRLAKVLPSGRRHNWPAPFT